MTREEAVKAIEAGEKVTHAYFTSDEWVSICPEGYIFEDGCICPPREFWAFRQDSDFEEGWGLFNEKGGES